MTEKKELDNRQIKMGDGSNYNELIERDYIQGNAYYICNYYYREDVRVTPVKPADASGEDSLSCPYRGLFQFGPNDTEFFFGREVFVEELIQATARWSFIPVLGASGSGKSSVVLAGLVPRLQQQGNWKFTHFRPGSDPFYALAEALVPLYTPNLDATDQLAQTRKLANYFDQGEVTLTDVIANIQRRHPNHQVLLIADQFEEIYTSCKNESTRRRFLDCLLSLIQKDTNQLPTVLVATMRADFLSNALEYRPFADVLHNDIKLRPMNRKELLEVIEKPAQKLRITLEAGLVERILDDVENEPGNLPLLEFALTLLWERRTDKQLTHAGYEAIGKVQGALASYADKIYSKFNATEQQQVRRIFMRLACPGQGTEDTRRIATKSELGEVSWLSVSQLADARLVVTSRNSSGQETVEIVHEALIRHWQLLRSWIDENRSKIIQKNRIERLAIEWQDNKHLNDYLLQGKQLNEAKAFQKKQASLFTLSNLACEFIQSSIRQRQNKRAIVLGIILSSMVGVSILVKEDIVRLLQVRQYWAEFYTAKKQNDISKIKLVVGKLVEAKEDLAEINLSNYQLGSANFSNTNLTKANFSNTILGGANFSNTNLTEANFSNTILGGAYFSRADITGAIFNDANLGDAIFDNAILINAKLINAELGGAKLRKTKFRYANLSNADLGGADLGGADLSNANLNGAKFNYANLGNVKLNNAELQNANFENTRNLTPEQVKQAKHWQQAKYSKEFWY